MVERDLAKVEAAGSSPVSRFFHALKSVEIRFQGIFFVPEKAVCRILYGNHANCYFSRKRVCDKIEKDDCPRAAEFRRKEVKNK